MSARYNLKILIEARNNLNLRRVLLVFYVRGKCLKFAFKMPNLKTRLKSKIGVFWRLSISQINNKLYFMRGLLLILNLKRLFSVNCPI